MDYVVKKLQDKIAKEIQDYKMHNIKYKQLGIQSQLSQYIAYKCKLIKHSLSLF